MVGWRTKVPVVSHNLLLFHLATVECAGGRKRIAAWCKGPVYGIWVDSSGLRSRVLYPQCEMCIAN